MMITLRLAFLSATVLALIVVNGFVPAVNTHLHRHDHLSTAMTTLRNHHQNRRYEEESDPNTILVTRKEFFQKVFFASSAAVLFWTEVAHATDGNDDEAAAAAAKLKQQRADAMKRKIEASKKNYRTADDLYGFRKDNVDYSCVSSTGSPCKSDADGSNQEGPPANGQLEDL